MILDLGVIAILSFAALAWGANEPWAMAIIAMAALALLVLNVLWDVWHGRLKPNRSWIYAPLLLFLGCAAFQLLRLHTDLNLETPWLPHTVEGHSTTLYLLLATSYASIVFLVHNGFRSRTRVKMLVISVLTLGVFQSLYGLIQYLGDYNFIWDFKVSGTVAQGTFVNRNHYALLLNLIICTGLGYLYYRSIRLLRGWNLTVRHVVSSPGSGQLAWILLWVAIMGLAVVFSMSRMGIVAMFGCLGLMIMAGKASQQGKRASVLGLLLLFAVVSLAVHTGVDVILARFESITVPGYLEKDRLPIWRDAWKMVAEQPLFGQGLATFSWTYPAFESFEPDLPARYAHNDYIQALAEVGVVGLFLLLWGYCTCWRAATRNLYQSNDPLARGIGLGTLGVLTATALQELTDFSLFIPGVATTFAVLIGLNLRASSLEHELPLRNK